MSKKIVFLPGDGVGPEVSKAAQSVLECVERKHGLEFTVESHVFGGAAIDETGEPLPEKTLKACLAADAIFLGAVGGPKWDGGETRPEAGLLALRKELNVFANLRPTQVLAGLSSFSPLKEERVKGTDFVIVRELTGGLYFGNREEGTTQANDQCSYTEEEVARVARIAFATARGRKNKVTSVDKANVLATSRLWRHVVNEVHKNEFSDVELEHVLVDAMAMKLILSPSEFDVVLTENLFGDILSDEASVLAGSIGLAPSASLGEGGRGLYEPIHGSAPDIAGQDKANPTGAILSLAMMLRHSFGEEKAAEDIERSVVQIIRAGFRTGDLQGELGCSEFADAVCQQLLPNVLPHPITRRHL